MDLRTSNVNKDIENGLFYSSDSSNPKPSLNLLPYFFKDAVLSMAQTSITPSMSSSGVAVTKEVAEVRFFERLGTVYPTTWRHNMATLFWEPLILHDIPSFLNKRQKKQSTPNSAQRDTMVGVFNILHTD